MKRKQIVTYLRRTAACLLVIGSAATIGFGVRSRLRQAAEKAVCAPAPHRMVMIPAGPFIMGSDDPQAEPDERPARSVWEWVSDVYRDRVFFSWLSWGQERGILRGGAHSYGPFQARGSYQGFEGLEVTCNDVGFRCAMTAQPADPTP